MSHLEQTAVGQQQFFNRNRVSSPTNRNPENFSEFTPLEFRISNFLAIQETISV